VFQAGKLREAAEALDEALLTLRKRGDTEATARALQLRSRLAQRLAEGREIELAAEAVELLARETPGPALVAAYTQLANAQMIAGSYEDTIVTADAARALSERLGLPEPARALGYRGYARVYLGDGGGLTEMNAALAALVEQGAGRDAAILQNNLAIARFPFEGPARSLGACEEGIAFCVQRGLAGAAAQLESNFPILLAELGRTDEVFVSVDRLTAALVESGDMHALTEVRAVELATSMARGELEDAAARADWLSEVARTIRAADILVIALASAATALAAQAPKRAHSLLAEIEARTGTRETPYYSRQLPQMVRVALAGNDTKLAHRLVERLEPRYPLEKHALHTARAQLAEHAGETAQAARLYGEAATAWHEFGVVPERAHCLLGEGRSLLAHGRPEAGRRLREARELFAAMGYKPALAEAEGLLGETAASPAS
jgi:hypothetical protein